MCKEINLSERNSLSWQEALTAAEQSLASNDLATAFPLFRQLAAKLPSNGEVQFGYGQVLLRIEHFDEAIQQLQIACQLLPMRSDCLFVLADAFDLVDAQQDVKTIMNFIEQGFSSDPKVLYKLAHYARETGSFEHAEHLIQTCINLSPPPLLSAYAWQLLVNLPRPLQISHCEQKIKNLLTNASSKLPAGQEKQECSMIAHFALGRIYELMEEPENAFIEWQAANDIQSKFCTFSCNDMHSYFQALQNTQVQQINEQNTDNFTPIFILGLPRTGSTLLEQLLSQHALISSIGEQTILSQQSAAYLMKVTNNQYPDLLTQLTQEQVIKAASIYRNALLRRQRNTPFVIDKLPANFQSIDLIFTLFPHAKVIDIHRHFPAVALSVFRNHFAENEPYFCNLQELSQYQRFYLDSMMHFKQRYPDKILDVHYEKLVSHPSAVLADVFQFCGVQTGVSEQDIADICKFSHTQSNRVFTLSASQVKQGISGENIDKYASYLPMMQQAGLVI